MQTVEEFLETAKNWKSDASLEIRERFGEAFNFGLRVVSYILPLNALEKLSAEQKKLRDKLEEISRRTSHEIAKLGKQALSAQNLVENMGIKGME